MKLLKELENDVYEFELYDDYFSIKTIYCEKNEEVSSLTEIEEAEEEEESEQQEILPRIIAFKEQSVNIVEIKEMFVVFLKKQTIYALPKRFISELEQNKMREVFSENIGQDFVIKNS